MKNEKLDLAFVCHFLSTASVLTSLSERYSDYNLCVLYERATADSSVVTYDDSDNNIKAITLHVLDDEIKGIIVYSDNDYYHHMTDPLLVEGDNIPSILESISLSAIREMMK